MKKSATRRPRPGGRPQRRTAVDQVRRAAYDVVHAVSTDDAYANLLLPKVLRERELSGRDAAFATELVHGTLRWRGTYDEIVARCVDRELAKLDSEVLDVLRLGTHQLVGMRVPSHAAVDTCVDLTRAVAGHGSAKFVNAILRRISTRDLDAWLAEIAPAYDTDPVGWLASMHAHPRWIVEAFRSALDGSLDQTAALLAADNAPPKVTLAAWPGRSTVDELESAGARRGRWSPYAVELDSGDPSGLRPVRQGRAGVQDEGSQLVALALADVELGEPPTPTTPTTPERWLDMCAGPGGKAALLAGVAGQRNARLLAAERQSHRARLVAGAFGRHRNPGTLGVVVADGTNPAWPAGRFDRVLVDAPCSGLGALRRRPESRWRRSAADVEELRETQKALLRSALESVRVGGVVAYVTCSPHPRETRELVTDVLEGRSNVEHVDARPYLPAALPDLGHGPDVQLWPHLHGTDAMYLALLRRTDRP